MGGVWAVDVVFFKFGYLSLSSCPLFFFLLRQPRFLLDGSPLSILYVRAPLFFVGGFERSL